MNSQNGFYFVTICTKDRVENFGEMKDEMMIVNDFGEIVKQQWLWLKEQYSYVGIDEYVVMPNHVHGIIEIRPDNNEYESDVGMKNIVSPTVGVQNVRVQNFEPLLQQNQFQKIIPRSIGSIIRGFKIGVTKWFRAHTDISTVWQRNYYEHIIRDEQSYEQISEYIQSNPLKWLDDTYYA